MPEQPVLVVNVDSSEYIYMHSIDASEAVKIGDHRYATLEEQQESSDKKATALNRMRSVNVNPPPELQTAEQKAAIRAQAAAEAGTPPEEPLGVRQALGASPTPAPTPPTAPPEATQRSRRGE